jgi:glycosyltransferase involved in cell wall biosynthesis
MKASVLFLCYNQEKFVSQAIRSALNQDYNDYEIIVCDDGSSDDTVKILNDELIKCPSHVKITKCYNKNNLGLIRNFDQGLSKCVGDFVVLMAGDDVSDSNRIKTLSDEFTQNPKCELICANWLFIDKDGKSMNAYGKHTKKLIFSYDYSKLSKGIYAGSPVCGAAAAFRTHLRDIFGPMIGGSYSEDNCYWIRALLVGNVHYIPQVLVQWRKHDKNIHNSDKKDKIKFIKYYFRFLKSHKFCSLQWRKDIDTAFNKSLISSKQKNALIKCIYMDIERMRLRRLSLSSAPWQLWIGSCKKMLSFESSLKTYRRIFLSAFILRVSPLHKYIFWKKHI